MTCSDPVETMNLPPWKQEKCLLIAAYKVKLQSKNGEDIFPCVFLVNTENIMATIETSWKYEINSIFNKVFFKLVILGEVSRWIKPNADEKRIFFRRIVR